MRIVRSPRAMHAVARVAHAAGRTLAFVPTMGALHEGHLSLVTRARRLADVVVASVFVNPLQFGPTEDYTRYPRDLRRDSVLLRAAGVDVLFAPSVEEMYPEPPLTKVSVPALSERLCGRVRPGHFDGVCIVVLKLLHIVDPDVLVLGRKDAQQAAIVRRMVADLNVPTRVVVAPTVREPSGLAMSSRNAYLSAEERAVSPGLSRALEHAASEIRAGETNVVRIRAALESALRGLPGFRLQYAEIVRVDTLAPAVSVEEPVLIAAAGFFGATRLIDNVIAHPPGSRRHAVRRRTNGRRAR
jgi:pantoate--beta-alanine ligase